MGASYSYNVVSAKATKELAVFGKQKILLCDIQCEDEHEHLLAEAKDVVVVVEHGHAQFEHYPENFLPEEASEAEYEKWRDLCENGWPGYEAYDGNVLGSLLQQAASEKQTGTRKSCVTDQNDPNFDAWAEHPTWPRSDWKYEVANDDTVLGYWQWVEHQIEASSQAG